MISGQETQAAGIKGQGTVQPVLKRKIGNGRALNICNVFLPDNKSLKIKQVLEVVN
jgi:hypothetical protein